MFVYNKPADHPRITKEELYYIEKSIGNQESHEVSLIYKDFRKL